MQRRFSVRPMRLADMHRILAIERASFAADAYDRNLFAEYHRLAGPLFLVVEGSGGVCGYAIVFPGERAELISIAVAPRHRGTGAARALMASLLRRLKRRGIPRLNLTVKVTNDRARAFYESYGFRKLRRVPGYYEDGADGVLMRLELMKWHME